jgi:hypothetical protein
LGSAPDAESGVLAATLSGRIFNLQVIPGPPGQQGPINTFILPVVPDAPEDNEDLPVGQGRLVQALGNEWFLERIVGKLFLSLRLGQSTLDTRHALVGAGFFVARASDEDFGGGIDLPIGAEDFQRRNSNYSPIHEDVIREPWLWRRTWILGGQFNAQEGYNQFPSTNAFYGSVMDGPHIDAKSVRRIGNDERLFFAISTANFKSNSAGLDTNNTVDGYLDLRVLGSLRRARGKSTF